MRNYFTIFFSFLLLFTIKEVNAKKIEIYISDFSNNEVVLVRYYGSSYKIIDSTNLDKTGKLSLGKLISDNGIYGVILYDTKTLKVLDDPIQVSYSYILNFIYDRKDVILSCDIRNPIKTMIVKESEINREYFALLKNQMQVLSTFKEYKFPLSNLEQQQQVLQNFGEISSEMNDINPTFKITSFSNIFSPYFQEGINYYHKMPEENELFMHDEITLSSSAFQFAFWNVMNQKKDFDTTSIFLEKVKNYYGNYPSEMDIISKYIYQNVFFRDTFQNDKLMTWTWNNFFKSMGYNWQTPLDRTFLNEFGSKIGALPIGEVFPLKDFRDSSGNLKNFEDYKDAQYFVLHFIDGNIQNDINRLSKQHKGYVKYQMDTMNVIYLMVCINESGRRFFDAEMMQRKYKGFEAIYFYTDDKNWNIGYYWNIKFGNVFIVDKNSILLSKGYSNLSDKIYKEYFMK